MGRLFLYDKNIIFTVEAFVFIFPVLVEIRFKLGEDLFYILEEVAFG